MKTTNYAGPVRVTRPCGHAIEGDGGRLAPSMEIRPPYTKRQLDDIIRQGKDRPRPLTHDETTRAADNRRVARGDLLAMETWYRFNCRGALRGRELWLARHPGPKWSVPDEGSQRDRWR